MNIDVETDMIRWMSGVYISWWWRVIAVIRKRTDILYIYIYCRCKIYFFNERSIEIFYVYWTVHHLDSWIKRDQLAVTCFIISLFNAQHVSDVNTSILRSLRLIYGVISWVVLLWFDVCWCYDVVWLWWCGIRMQAETLVPQPAYGYHTIPAKLQRSNNTHRARAIQPMK